MKKFLSLVLALVMTMSLVTVSAGAKDFTDASDVNYDEAIDVMSAIGVISGYDDGSIKPQGALTRGAAAKIICNLILGPTDANALAVTEAPYKDVPANSTFAGYISYCKSEGFVSGYADGTFKPGAPLTGYAFMKMLLGALGFDSSIEGYTGSNWSVNVAKRALALKLADDLNGDFVGTKSINREEAMLFAFNALKADTYKYNSKGQNINVGGVVINTGASEATKAGETLATKLFGSKLSGDDVYDKLGNPATTWTYKNKEIGTYAKEADATYTVDVKNSTVAKELNSTDTFYYYVDGVQAYNKDFVTLDKTKDKKMGFGMGNGAVAAFYKDEQVYTVTNTYIGKVTAIGKDSEGERQIKVTAYAGSVSGATLTTKDWKLDDIVLFTVSKGLTGSAKEIQSIVAVEKQTGTLTKVNNGKYTIDGTVYELSNKADNNVSASDVSKKVDFYLDSYGYIIKMDLADETVSLDNLAVILWNGTNAKDSSQKLVDLLKLSDGTKVVDADVDNDTVITQPSHKGRLVSYKLKSNGAYNLSTSAETYYYAFGATDADVTNVYFKNGETVVKDAVVNTPIKVDSQTNFVYINAKNEVSTYVGYKAAPSFTCDAGTVLTAYRKDTTGPVDVLVVYHPVANSLTLASTKLTWVMTDKDSKIVSEAKGDDTISYYEYNAIVEGKVTTLRVDADTAFDIMTYYVDGVAYGESAMVAASKTVDTDGIVDGLTPAAVGKVTTVTTAEALKNDVLTLGGVGYSVAEGVKVFSVNADSEIEEVTISAVTKDVDNAETYDPFTHIKYTLNSDGEVDFIVLFVK